MTTKLRKSWRGHGETVQYRSARHDPSCCSALVFNGAMPPFNDVRVRQAFTTAIDREAWVDKVRNGVGVPAVSWLPPGLPGFDPELGAEYAFDPDRAKELLRQAGFQDGEFPSVTYTFFTAGDQRTIAEFLQAQFKENLGVDVTLEPLDPPAFFPQVLGARDFQIIALEWSGDYADPESFLAPLFTSTAFNNFFGYTNSQFDSLAGQAAAELDQTTRLDLWKQAHEIMVAEVPVAPFFYQERFFLKKPEVQGLILSPIDGSIPGDTSLAGVSISP